MKTQILLLPHFPADIDPNTLNAYGGESAGLDLYNAGPAITIVGGDHTTRILMPTGIKVNIPSGYVGLIQERSSIVKTPLKVRAGVIDAGYTGEVLVNMINPFPHSTYTLPANVKSPFQLIIVPKGSFELVNQEEYNMLTSNSQRKEGKIGSSDGQQRS